MELIQAVESALVTVTVVTNILCKAPHHLEVQEEDCAALCPCVTFAACGVLCPRGQCDSLIIKGGDGE